MIKFGARTITSYPSGFIGIVFFSSVFFVQYGYTNVVSVAVFGLALLLFYTFQREGLHVAIFLYLAIATVSYFVYLLINQEIKNLLQDIRVTILALTYFYLMGSRPIYIRSIFPLMLLVSISSFFCFYQFAAQYFGEMPVVIPDYFFANSEDNALASLGLLRASEYGYIFTFRPSGFFSEPSYMGLVSIAILYTVLELKAHLGKVFYFAIIIMLLFGVLFSQSFFGLFGSFLMLTFKYYKEIRHYAWIILFMFVSFVVGYLNLNLEVFSRLDSVLRLDDASTIVRFLLPMYFTLDVMSNYPLGMPFSELSGFYLQHGVFYSGYSGGENPFNNGFFVIFMMYGVLAFFVVFLMFAVLRSKFERLLLIMFLLQNGAFFSFDKIYLFSFFILLVRAYKSIEKVDNTRCIND